jgi:hypothetical protein
LVEHGATTKAVASLQQQQQPLQHPTLTLALLANLLLDMRPAKRLFLEAGGPHVVSQLALSSPALCWSALILLRNAAHGAELAVKIALLDAFPFSHIATLVRTGTADVGEAALALVRNLLHHDAPQVCIKLDATELLAIASLPLHLQNPPSLVQALYVLCNVAAATEDHRAQLLQHEGAISLLSAALASPHAPARVAALWTLYNLTWHHPARTSVLAQKGFSARLSLLRADPVTDVRERACMISWL